MAKRISPRAPAFFIVSVALLAAAVLCAALTSASGQTDDEIRAAIAKAGTAKDHEDAQFVAVFDKTDVTVEESGLAHYRRHTLTKILTEEGAIARSALRFDYDPASNMIEVAGIRVFRAGGAIETVDLSTVRDLFAPAAAIYWGARMKTIGLPRLRPGDAVEVKTYKKGFEIAYLGEGEGASGGAAPGSAGAIAPAGAGEPASTGAPAAEDDSRYIPPMRGHFYDVVYFQDAFPILEKRYDLHMPKDKPIQYRVYHGALGAEQRFDGAGTHYAWWITDAAPLAEEPRGAEAPDVAVKLVLATIPSWQEKSKWFASIHDTIFLDDPAIEAKVAEITAGCTTDLEKVTALQHWSAQEIRYSGISMGKGEGYTIHPGKMIFNDRCGVCKDKAGMLITLMRSAGYEVFPALTMAGARVEEIPADQFNHCVVAWRHADGSYTMLDPTWVPYSTELWSSAEQEQNYIIGTPWGEPLMETPYSGPENHVLTIQSRGAIDAAGNLTGTLKISATRYMDQRMRRLFGTHRRDDMRSFLEGMLAAISPAAELERWSAGSALDFGKQYAVEVTYRVPRYAVVDGKTIDFRSPGWAFALGNAPFLPAAAAIDLETRTTPLFIWHTETLDCAETIRLPQGYKPREAASPVKESGEYAAVDISRSFREPAVSLAGKVLVKRRMIPVDSYAAFRAALKKAASYADERIIAER